MKNFVILLWTTDSIDILYLNMILNNKVNNSTNFFPFSESHQNK